MAAQELLKTVLFNNANLKAYYRFESGALTTDSSGNGKTLTNNNTVGEGAGVYGGAADFGATNTNKYFSIADNLSIDGGTGSINLWWNSPTTTSASDHETLAATFNGTVHSGLSLTLGNTGVRASRIKANVAWEDTSEIALSTNTWYMVTVTCDAVTLRLYVNGQHRASTGVNANGTGTDPSKTTIGSRADAAVSYADGIIDDVAFFNVALSADQIKELYEGRFIGESYPQAGLVAGYHLNGSSTDFSGNNNHGTDTAITYSQANGKFGQGAGFNGSSSYITGGTSTAHNFTGDFTISAWIYPTSVTSYHILVYRQVYNSAGYNFYMNADKLELNTNNTAAVTSTSVSALAINTWQHITVVHSGTSALFYKNGNLLANGASGSHTGPATLSAVLNIGRDPAPSQYFAGNMDELLMFNRALTSQEIRRMYAVAKGMYQ